MIKKTLYFGNPAYLSMRRNQLVVEKPKTKYEKMFSDEQRTQTIPIEDIAIVVLDHRQITITQGLLSLLLQHAVAVVICDERCMPIALQLPLSGNTLHSERFQHQLKASEPLRKQMWQQTVKAKIKNQADVLQHTTQAPIKRMLNLADNVRSGDSNNAEGIAAAYYWDNMFPQLTDFLRAREGECPNQMLNYGYAILRATMARALVMAGLLPVYGIHHHNRYNAYCLADDMMEPYRPAVDALVDQMLKRYGRTDDLTLEMKADLLSIPSIYVEMEGCKNPIMTATRLTAVSLHKCFAGEQRKISYPKLIW